MKQVKLVKEVMLCRKLSPSWKVRSGILEIGHVVAEATTVALGKFGLFV